MIGTIIILNSAVEGVAPEKRSGVRSNAGVPHSEPGTTGNPSQYFRSQTLAFEEQSRLLEKRFVMSCVDREEL